MRPKTFLGPKLSRFQKPQYLQNTLFGGVRSLPIWVVYTPRLTLKSELEFTVGEHVAQTRYRSAIRQPKWLKVGQNVRPKVAPPSLQRRTYTPRPNTATQSTRNQSVVQNVKIKKMKIRIAPPKDVSLNFYFIPQNISVFNSFTVDISTPWWSA